MDGCGTTEPPGGGGGLFRGRGTGLVFFPRSSLDFDLEGFAGALDGLLSTDLVSLTGSFKTGVRERFKVFPDLVSFTGGFKAGLLGAFKALLG